ncbi:hypothetical protein GCM10010174_14370 [Kutzneria viridogrisea]|uniref:Transglycosylase SLT domain-containing protein n=2 Tax=Kutzneria TaxID=43356 RepID=W5WJ82_9PSEU|nr:transglycosylase SLT domain-containing protein [Kutzneria albida]AHI00938.1 hypothetical protein KALB_7580 [Kutzneria albida DSM 43870]MBA8926215.1 hypothetical protein [Kutzneria viridogrisea]
MPRMIAVSAATVLAGVVPGTVLPNPVPAAVERKCTSYNKYEGEHYQPKQLAQLAKQAGFTEEDLVIAVAVALAESSGWTKAVLVNENCTTDRGLWQINDYWHPEVTEKQAFDPPTNVRVAYQIFMESQNWKPWSTFESGAYKENMDTAREAVKELNAS